MAKHEKCGCTRRQTLRTILGSSLVLPAILSDLLAAGPPAAAEPDPLAPKPPQFPARAKRVIFLHMSGGVSHVDTLDYKPKLFADHGKKTEKGLYLCRPKWNFKPYGKSGTQVSDLLPNMGGCVDDICLIHSMQNDHNDHQQATLGIHTGSVTFARPSTGSWVSYGLGTVNRNLPSFVVLAPQLPYAGTQVWGSDILPAVHQGTRIVPGAEPIPNLKPRDPSPEIQEMELGLLDFFNREHQRERGPDAALAARIKSFETAFRMQAEAPEAFDLSKESDATLKLYGLERGSTAGFAWQCLVARRLAERGVRYIELIDSGSNTNWDAHSDMQTCAPLAKNIDQATAGLLKDLAATGLLKDTLVVWTTEFGRTPFCVQADAKGREHYNLAFTSWMAGGGVKAGMVYGKTDDYGIDIVSDPVHIHDFHATMLYLLGIDHTKLTYRHAGRDYRLTDVSGEVIKDIVA